MSETIPVLRGADAHRVIDPKVYGNWTAALDVPAEGIAVEVNEADLAANLDEKGKKK